MDCSLPGSSVHGDSPGQNTGVGSHSLLQGIFPTQGLNPGLPSALQVDSLLSGGYQGSPRMLEWVIHPISRESSWSRNWTGISCIAGGFFTCWATKEAPSFNYSCVICCFKFDVSSCAPGEAMAPHSSTLAWKIPWAEEPGRLQSMGSLESDMTERLHFHFSLSCTGEGNGNPLQCSCLENPRDGGAWWAVVYGVTQSRTRLKRLSSMYPSVHCSNIHNS